MKRSFLTAGFAVAVAAAAATAASAFGATGTARPVTACPSGAKTRATARVPERLVAAVRREVPRTYVIANQSGRVPLTPKHYQIDQILYLTPSYPESRDARRYRAIAENRCGAAVANRSWLVVVRFPEAQSIPASYGLMFFAETRTGWRMWWRYH